MIKLDQADRGVRGNNSSRRSKARRQTGIQPRLVGVSGRADWSVFGIEVERELFPVVAEAEAEASSTEINPRVRQERFDCVVAVRDPERAEIRLLRLSQAPLFLGCRFGRRLRFSSSRGERTLPQ